MQLQDPNHGISNLLYFPMGSKWQQVAAAAKNKRAYVQDICARAITALILYCEYSTVGSFDSPTQSTINT